MKLRTAALAAFLLHGAIFSAAERGPDFYAGAFAPPNVGNPTPVVVTDANGNTLTVSGIAGSASGTKVGNPTPVVLTDANGNVLTLSSSGGGLSPVQSGLIAECLFLDGSGTAPVDASGNNNCGTFAAGGNAPTWNTPANGGGVIFSSTAVTWISLPAAVNAGQTFQVFMLHQPRTTATQGSNDCIVAGNVASNSAAWYMTVANLQGLVYPSPFNNTIVERFASINQTNFASESRAVANGSNFYTWLLDSPNDRFFTGPNEHLYFAKNGSSSGKQATGNFQLGGTTNTFHGAGVCAMTSTVYFFLAYNRVLLNSEVAANAAWASQYAATRGIPTFDGDNTTQGALVIGDGDSEMASAANFPAISTMVVPAGTNVFNNALPSTTALMAFNNLPLGILAAFRQTGNNQVVVLETGTNDNAQTLAFELGYQSGYCAKVRAVGAKCIIWPVFDRTGATAWKNTLNAGLVANWQNFADGFIMPSDPLLFADGAAANTSCFDGIGTHYISYCAWNDATPLIQKAIFKTVFGNLNWAQATTYATGAPAATAITAASESTNTMTFTTTLNPGVGSSVVVTGVTPAGYNSPASGWYVITSSATNFTAFNSTTGLGAGTVFGTVSVPLQKDGDVYAVLGGVAAAQNFTLESCMGQSTPTLLRVTDTNAWTITPFTGAETINGAATFTTPVAAASNNPVVRLDPILASTAAATCTWKASLQ